MKCLQEKACPNEVDKSTITKSVQFHAAHAKKQKFVQPQRSKAIAHIKGLEDVHCRREDPDDERLQSQNHNVKRLCVADNFAALFTTVGKTNHVAIDSTHLATYTWTADVTKNAIPSDKVISRESERRWLHVVVQH